MLLDSLALKKELSSKWTESDVVKKDFPVLQAVSVD